jgi:alpha-N-arabinofuranosidase
LPIGPEAAVVIDREHLYAGDHAPLIRLEGGDPRGIRQNGLALRKGKAYTGRIVLAGDPGAQITITMGWGSGPGERRTMPPAGVRAAYASFPFKFIAEGDSDDGRIEISGTGRGSFRIGAVSLMPAGNIKGFRRRSSRC